MADLQYSSVVFDDVDHYRQWSDGMGWELRSTQISHGKNRIAFDHLAFPEFSVSRHSARRTMYDAFAIPQGHIVFVICRVKLPAVWCGMELAPSMLAIHRPGRTYTARLPAGWDTYEFTFSEEMITRTELFPLDFFEKTFQVEQSLVPLVEPQTGHFLNRMDSYFQMIRTAGDAMSDALSTNNFYHFILHRLQQLIDSGLGAGLTQSLQYTRRADLVVQARDLMIANLQLDLTADEIAQSLGVSYRVLNYAFQDALGVSPYRYLLTEKLHAVRRDLKDSDASIAGVCLSYGFSTPSRFARQYRRLFGELPSQTRMKQTGALIR